MLATPHNDTKPLSEPFSAADSSFFSLDSATTRQVIAAFLPLDSVPDHRALEKRFESILPIFPRLKCKVLKEKRLQWIEDREFSLNNHLELRYEPSINSLSDLTRFASEEFSRGIDESRPLWRFIVITNSNQSGRDLLSPGAAFGAPFAAGLFCLHHSLADGRGALEILNTLFAKSPELSMSVYHQEQAPHSVASGKSQPRRAFSLWSSLRKVAAEALVPCARSPLNGTNSASRVLSTLDLPLAEIRRIKTACGCSANDVLLGVLATALRRYHEAIDQIPRNDLRAVMPVSLRNISAKRCLGNHLSAVGVRLPITMVDPVEQLRVISSYISKLKHEGAFGAYAVLGRIGARLPARLQTYFCQRQAKRTNFICTNLPGSPRPQYLAGARVQGNYGMAALLHGHGLSFAFISYVGKICASIVSDPQIVPSPQLLFLHVESVFHELRERFGEGDKVAV